MKRLAKPRSKRAHRPLLHRPAFVAPAFVVIMALSIGTGLWLVSNSRAATAPVGQSGNWSLAFSDEFNGASLDTTKWITCNPSFAANCAPWNNEQQLYTPNNVTVSGGLLHLTAKKQDIVGPNTSGGTKTYHYTSGMIASGPNKFGANQPGYAGFQHTYGYYEINAKVPRGNGYWPSTWMLPDQNVYGGWPGSGEYDVFEIAGNDPTAVYMTEHDGTNGGPGNGETKYGADMSVGYHTYGFEWAADHLAWYIDGVRARSMICTNAYANAHPGVCNSYRDAGAIKNFPFYLIANFSVGGDWPPLNGKPDANTPFPAEMSIDWIRFWVPGSATATPAAPTAVPTAVPTPVKTATPKPTTVPTKTPTPTPVSTADPEPEATPIPPSDDGSGDPIVIAPTEGNDDVPVTKGGDPELSNTVTIAPPGSDGATVTVDGTIVSRDGTLDTRYLNNGTHTVTVESTDGKTATRTVSVKNDLTVMEVFRNKLFAPFKGNKTLVNDSLWGLVGLAGLTVVLFTFRWWVRRRIARRAWTNLSKLK
jgi:beta-glucanase (GH16 family)